MRVNKRVNPSRRFGCRLERQNVLFRGKRKGRRNKRRKARRRGRKNKRRKGRKKGRRKNSRKSVRWSAVPVAPW